MKVHSLALCFVLATLLHVKARAEGDHAAPKGSSRAGAHMAVTAFDPQEGFKMTEPVLGGLGVSFAKLEGSAAWVLPKAALVRIKHVTGVYRRADGWITFVLVASTSKGKDSVQVKSEDLQSGDEVAVQGASFLRLTEADLNADTVDSCAH